MDTKLATIQQNSLQGISEMTALVVRPEGFDPVARAIAWDQEHKTDLVATAQKLVEEVNLSSDVMSLASFGAGVLDRYGNTAQTVLKGTSLAEAALADDAFNNFLLSMRGVDLKKAMKFPAWLAKILPWFDPLKHTIRSMNSLWSEMEAHKAEMREQQRKIVAYMALYQDVDERAKEALPFLFTYAAAMQMLYEREEKVLAELARANQDGGMEAQAKYQRQSMLLTAIGERQARFVESAFRLWIMRNVVTNAWGIAFVTSNALSGLIDLTMPDLVMTFSVIVMQAQQSKVLEKMSITSRVSREAMLTMVEALSRNTGALRQYLTENYGQLEQYQAAVEKIVETVESVVAMQREFKSQVQSFQEGTGQLEQRLAEAITTAHGKV